MKLPSFLLFLPANLPKDTIQNLFNLIQPAYLSITRQDNFERDFRGGKER